MAVPVTATVITFNEAANIQAALESLSWADEIIVVDSESTDDTVAIAREFTDKVIVRAWPGYIAQKNFAAEQASHDWIFSLDADERVSPALADEIKALRRSADRRPPAIACRASRFISGAGCDRPTGIPTTSCASTIGAARAGRAGYVHESVKADGAVTDLRGELLHYAYRDLAHHFQTMDRYTTLAARQMFEDGRRAGFFDLAVASAGGVSPQLPAPWRLSRRHARPDRLGDECALCRAEVCETLGAVFALHIDTARTWRGGQQQVLLTVLGLRARGHRAVLVAHPRGRAVRRASEGPDLVPLAPMNEIDLATAWKLSKIIRQWKPAIVHAHDPHAVSMTALALSFGAPVPRPKVDRLAARRFSPAGATRSRSGSIGRSTGSSPRRGAIQRHPGRRRHPGRTRSTWCTTASMSTRSRNRPATDLHAEYWLPHGVPVIVNVGALVGAQGSEVPDRRHAAGVARGAGRAPGDLRRGRAAGAAGEADQAVVARRSACCCRAFAKTCCR